METRKQIPKAGKSLEQSWRTQFPKSKPLWIYTIEKATRTSSSAASLLQPWEHRDGSYSHRSPNSCHPSLLSYPLLSLEEAFVTCPDGCVHLRELLPQPAWPAQHLPHTERWLPPAWQMPHDNLWTQKESTGKGLGLSLESSEVVVINLPNAATL